MTQEEFYNTNWHRGNIVRLENGKEYEVKGTKSHGRFLLLFSEEYEKCFVADHNIVDIRISDYEEPEEVYLEHKRQRQAEAQARREAEKQEYLRMKKERKQKNIQEQERMHLEAVARKAAKAEARVLAAQQAAAEKAKKAIAPAPTRSIPSKPEPFPETSFTPKTVAASETAATPEQPKRKRQRIKISHPTKLKW